MDDEGIEERAFFGLEDPGDGVWVVALNGVLSVRSRRWMRRWDSCPIKRVMMACDG